MLIVATSSPSRRPSLDSGPTHRAPSTRRKCAVREERDRGRRPPRPRAIDAVGPRADLLGGLAVRHAAREDRPAGNLFGCRRWCGPRSRRSPTREVVVDDRVVGRAPRARTSRWRAAAGSRARARSLAAKRGCERAAACSRPASVSGMSVYAVWRPDLLHSVAPCRTSTTCSSSAIRPPLLRKQGRCKRVDAYDGRNN